MRYHTFKALHATFVLIIIYSTPSEIHSACDGFMAIYWPTKSWTHPIIWWQFSLFVCHKLSQHQMIPLVFYFTMIELNIKCTWCVTTRRKTCISSANISIPFGERKKNAVKKNCCASNWRIETMQSNAMHFYSLVTHIFRARKYYHIEWEGRGKRQKRNQVNSDYVRLLPIMHNFVIIWDLFFFFVLETRKLFSITSPKYGFLAWKAHS